MVSKSFQAVVGTAIVLATASTAFNSANATNGYFQHGYGASSKALAGAGVALSQDSLAAATNPAAMVHVGNRADVEVGAFMPNRQAYGTTVGSNINGTFKSDQSFFIIPQFGMNMMLDETSSLGLSMAANGGMNTDYSINPFVNFGAGTSTGINAGAGAAGVDLAQALLGLTYAKKFNNHSFGITPTLAAQRFDAYGLQGFEQISASPFNVHGNGYDYSYGYGLRIGYQGQITNDLTIGAAASSKMYMQKFEKYSGLFAEQGGFDIPANFTLGAAYKINPDLTLVADWQYIAYGDVASIANTGADEFTTNCVGARALGGNNGCGFGWDDQHIVKVGAMYSGFDNLVLRAGVSHNSQVYDNNESMFNILAPAVIRTHVSVGASYSFSETHELNVAYTRGLNATQVGTHPNQPGSTVTHKMKQNDFIIGYSYKW